MRIVGSSRRLELQWPSVVEFAYTVPVSRMNPKDNQYVTQFRGSFARITQGASHPLTHVSRSVALVSRSSHVSWRLELRASFALVSRVFRRCFTAFTGGITHFSRVFRGSYIQIHVVKLCHILVVLIGFVWVMAVNAVAREHARA